MQTITKPVHGEPRPLWEQLGLKEAPPIECKFAIGDEVTFHNDYGLSCPMFVAGFSDHVTTFGGFIHLTRDPDKVSGSAWWFPNRPDQLTKGGART